MARTDKTTYLIIGNAAGGIGAAEAIREVDKAGAITIISDEPYPIYSRPLISEYLADRYPLERMLFHTPDFDEQSNIWTLLGEQVVQDNFSEHIVELESERTVIWQRLLLATGGLPIAPRLEGIGLRAVFTFIKLDGAKAIDRFLNEYAKRIRTVVIGGGLMG